MTKQGSAPFSEETRLRAVELVRDGWRPSRVAKALGCSIRSVQLWVKKSNNGRRKSALKTGKAPGATPKLDGKQKQQLLKLLRRGPEATGFAGQLWTCPRIAELIRREFGVTYHIRYLPTLLRSLGWSTQKPQKRAIERDDQAIATWIDRDWPRIKKNVAD